jgi:hypothetical protein
MYEVGLKTCADEEVRQLYTIADRFVKQEMKQTALYFTATRFTLPK